MTRSRNDLSTPCPNKSKMPRKEKIRELFDDIAADYDKLNHILSFGTDRIWRRRAARALKKGISAEKLLDVAGGTGDFAIELAKRIPEAGTICCLDLSEKMLEVAAVKIARLGLSKRIECRQGDCESLPYADGSFDGVSVGFGVRNFEHLEKGISEMCRVLREGGRLVILELSYPDNTLLNACFRFYARRILPSIGGRVSGNRGAYDYLPASILAFPKQDVMLPLLGRCGFRKAVHKAFCFGVCRMYIAEK